MRKVIMALATVLMIMFVSCSAEIVKDLPSEEIKPNSRSINIEVLSGNSFSISFTPVPYSSGYKYSLNGGEVSSFSTDSYHNGIITAVVSDVTEKSGTVELYAVSNSSSSEVSIASAPYALTISSIKPDAYLSSRNETSAEIRVYTSLEEGSVVYLAEVNAEDGTILPVYSESPVINVEGLEPGKAYTAEIYHALKNGEELKGEDSVSTTVEIPAYSQDSSAVMTLDVNEESNFVVSNIPAGVSVVSVMKSSDASMKDATLLYVYNEIHSSEAELPVENLECLETGYFYIQAGDYRSNIVKYTRPLEENEFAVNYQSFEVAFSFAEDFNSDDYDIYVDGISNEITSEEGGVVTVSNLASNTDYGTVTLCFRNKMTQEVFEYELEVKTNSFVGTYYWYNPTGEGPSNFIIDVTEAELGSAYPYYVYFNIADQSVSGISDYENNKLRIMPLLDEAAGDPSPSTNVNVGNPQSGYEQANNAYLTNSKKWNTTSMTPSSWRISSTPGEDEGIIDHVLTETTSKALFINATTWTRFSFMEADINNDGQVEPFVKFKNTGDKFAKLGLTTNASPQSTKFNDLSETEPESCWYLVKAEDSEAEK